MSDRKTTSENGPPNGRRIWFIVGAVAIGLLPLVALEAGLRVFDVGRPAAAPDPFAGFNRSFPLFERQGGIYRTSRTREPLIAPQEFAVEKPRNGFRIFCFGGSTVYGHPYLGDTAFPKWLELELAGSDSSRAWQAINCGGVSYASYRIAPMVREVLKYQPDLIILATGHNEFLEDRTYHDLKSRGAAWAWLQDKVYSLHAVTLARRGLARLRPAAAASGSNIDQGAELGPNITTRLDFASGYASYRRDDAWHRQVIAQFDESVRAIVADCRAARVPIILVKLGSNLRDCPPFKSEHQAALSPERETDWQAAFALATEAEKTDPPRALQMYREAAAIDGQHALLNYRIARVLDRGGRPAEALPYYQRAKDEDICPLRIITPLEQALVRIATDNAVPLVDAAGLLAARSPEGIPGNDCYVDHVHPNIGGDQLIAREVTAQMRASGILAPSALWPEAQRLETYARHLASLGPAYFADGKRRVGWLENWAQRQRLAAESLPHDAAGYARLGFLRIDLGDDEAAAAALAEALKRDPGASAMIRARAQELVAEGRPARAAALLRQLER